MTDKIDIRPNDALIIVDVQNDFISGTLAVPDGENIVSPINDFAKRFSNVIATQDWHPADHVSFETDDAVAFSTIALPYGDQTVWPKHCVQGTYGSDFHPDLDTLIFDAIIRKGANQNVDSYSAFLENDKATMTGLGGYLRSKGIKRCFFVGLAYDYCVGYSAIDCVVNEGMAAVVVKDLCRAIGDTSTIEENFRIVGVSSVELEEID